MYNRKRKGKSYYSDGILEFEGDYLFDKEWNGKMYDKNGNIMCELNNGKGYIKRYNDKGGLVFEGEYINGDISGKAKEYYDNGQLEFEGEYLKRLRNGKGKEYDLDGKLIFEGEYLKRLRSGKGKEYDSNGKLIFEGEYSYGERNNYSNKCNIFWKWKY